MEGDGFVCVSVRRSTKALLDEVRYLYREAILARYGVEKRRGGAKRVRLSYDLVVRWLCEKALRGGGRREAIRV